MKKVYERSCEDELDWAIVDQLHEATLQISKSSFEFKKICVGLIGAALAILVNLTGSTVGHLFFLVPMLICLGFWIADFSAYFFQRRTRNAMHRKLYAIALRNQIHSYESEGLEVSWLRAAFNHSMSLYYVLALLGLVGWIAYIKEWLG